MFTPQHRLDTPPPTSQFRRPWSPDPYTPATGLPSRVQSDDYFGHAYPAAPPIAHRELSDPSVEALDLVDYRHRLHGRPLASPASPYSPYDEYSMPPFPVAASATHDPYPPYPPSPRPIRPLVNIDTTRTPSLVTGEQSNITSIYSGNSPRTPRSRARPHSLPSSNGRTHHSYPADGKAPKVAAPDEIDISQFPAWSRGWYAPAPNGAASRNALVSSPPPLSPDFFDPARIPPAAHNPYAPYPSLTSIHGHSMDTHVLPWGESASDPPAYGVPVDDEVKAERMRMLEREFGKDASMGGDAEKVEWKVIGSVDEKGRLITDGPKKRVVARVLQLLLALATAITSIYAAVMIKPSSPPPPRGTAQVYVMYVLSVITVLATLYLFVFRPCCCGPRAHKPRDGLLGPGGMMVLPVHHLPGGNGEKNKNKKGKKDKQKGERDVQVNLIVDPTMFGHGRHSSDSESESDGAPEWDGTQWRSSTRSHHHGHGRRRRGPRRRGVFEGLALEENWRTARKELKRLFVLDIIFLLLWSAELVYILIGKRCPANEYDGWCDAYNVATAATSFTALAFGFSVFFGIKDLHASRASPRTRT